MFLMPALVAFAPAKYSSVLRLVYSNWRVSLRQRNIPNFDIVVAPLVEQFGASNLIGNLPGQNRVIGLGDLDFSAVGHVDQYRAF